jgi:hypothetical protein
MKVCDQPVDCLEAIARRDEDRRIAFERLNTPALVGRTLSRRRLVVPGDQASLPTAVCHSACSQLLHRSTPLGCITCEDVSSDFTGRKVPAPTCKVSVSRLIPRSSSAPGAAA